LLTPCLSKLPVILQRSARRWQCSARAPNGGGSSFTGFSLMVESTFSQANSFNPSHQLVKQLRCCFWLVALTRRVALQNVPRAAYSIPRVDGL
jgi:hypothetical protein